MGPIENYDNRFHPVTGSIIEHAGALAFGYGKLRNGKGRKIPCGRYDGLFWNAVNCLEEGMFPSSVKFAHSALCELRSEIKDREESVFQDRSKSIRTSSNYPLTSAWPLHVQSPVSIYL